MSTAEQALKLILRLSKDQHSKYAQALRDSIEWNREGNGRQPPSALQVSRWHSLPLKALEAQLVLLNKAEAASLLSDVGQPIGTPSLMKHVLTEDAYFKKFRRKVGKVGIRLVFTYAEVLVLAEFNGVYDLPDGLEKLI